MGVPSAEDDRTPEGAPMVEITAGKLGGMRVGGPRSPRSSGSRLPVRHQALCVSSASATCGWTGIRRAVVPGPVAMQVPTIWRADEDCRTDVGGLPEPQCLEPRFPARWHEDCRSCFGSTGSIRQWIRVGPWYDGSRLAARGDVVVVTINYRLGAFGFLDLSDLGGPGLPRSGNLGLLDQIAALRGAREHLGVRWRSEQGLPDRRISRCDERRHAPGDGCCEGHVSPGHPPERGPRRSAPRLIARHASVCSTSSAFRSAARGWNGSAPCLPRRSWWQRIG